MPSTQDFASPAMVRELLATMAVMEAKIRRAFIKSAGKVVSDPELIKLFDEIEADRYLSMTPGVEARIANVQVDMQEVVSLTRQAMVRAGNVTSKRVGLEIAFDMTNPRAIDFARQLGADMVRYVSDNVKANIRTIVGDLIEGTITPYQARKMIKQRVGLLPQHAVAVRNYEQNLITTGTSPKQVTRLTDQYANRLLKYRADMIARTEAARAMSYGQNELWQQAMDRGALPPDTMRVWIAEPTGNICQICEDNNGTTAPLNGGWNIVVNNTVKYIEYPTDSHPNCRCATGLVFPTKVGKVDPLGYEWWVLRKHLQGQHDQSSHGSWAKGRGRTRLLDAQEVFDDLRDIALERASMAGWADESRLKNLVSEEVGDLLSQEFSGQELADLTKELGIGLWGAEHALSKDWMNRQSVGITRAMFAEALKNYRRGSLLDDATGTYGDRKMSPLDIDRLFGAGAGKPAVVWVSLKNAGIQNAGLFPDLEPNSGIEWEVVGFVADPDPDSPYSGTVLLRGLHERRVELDMTAPAGTPQYVRPYGEVKIGDDTDNSIFNAMREAAGRAVKRDIESAAIGNEPEGIAQSFFGQKGSQPVALKEIYGGGYALVPGDEHPEGVLEKGRELDVLDRLGVLESKPNFGYPIVDAILKGWAGSSISRLSVEVQKAAGKMSGLADFDLTTVSDRYIEDGPLRLSDGSRKVLDRAVELMYENTQRALDKVPDGNVVLYRGLSSPDLQRVVDARSKKWDDYYAQARVEQRPLSSWSVQFDTAEEFATRYSGGDTPVIVATSVPKSRIFATPMTGMGCLEEGEMIVLGSEKDPMFIFGGDETGTGNLYHTRKEIQAILSEIGMSGAELEELKIKVEKHLAGQHDQKSHGSWSTGVIDGGGIGRYEDIPEAFRSAIDRRMKALGITEEMIVAELERAWSEASPEFKPAATEWYGRINSSCLSLATALNTKYGSKMTADQVAAVIAAMSPAREFVKNARDAKKLAEAVVADEPFDINLSDVRRLKASGADIMKLEKMLLGLGRQPRPSDFSPDQLHLLAPLHPVFGTLKNSTGFSPVVKALAIANGYTSIPDTLGGPKVRSFYNNIVDPSGIDVTIDTWMYRVMTPPNHRFKHRKGTGTLAEHAERLGDSFSTQGVFQDSPGPIKGTGIPDHVGTYPLFAELVRRLAASKGVSPSAAQAILWEVARTRAGYKPTSWEDVAEAFLL